MKTVQPWKEDSKRKNVTAKEKLEGIIQIAATNQNFSVAEEQQIEDEIAGVSTQRFQELRSRHFHFKQKTKHLVQYINTHFPLKTSSSQLINSISPTSL